jgi:WD40-like Beta Propeller Repeat
VSSPFDVDRQISAWLRETVPTREPEGLTDALLARTKQTRRLPSWAILERWLPMQTTYRFGAVPKAAILLVVLGLLVAVAGAVAVGQQDTRLPSPTGLARNGLIAFDLDGDIWVVEPDGTGRRQLTTGATQDSYPVWSQDGTRLAYWSQEHPDSTATLVVVDADGGAATPLVAGVTLEPMHATIAWSHDGRSLAYSRKDPEAASSDRIDIVAVDGGEPTKLVSPGMDPTWSPDDRLIAYHSGGIDAYGVEVASGLAVIGIDGTGFRQLDDAPDITGWAYSWPSWDPSGGRVVYHARPNGRSDIFVAAVDGSGVEIISDEVGQQDWPVYSPDGSRIAWNSPAVTLPGFQIVMAAADGTDPVRLAHSPLACDCVFWWSPDSTSVIAYQDGPVDVHTDGSMMIIDAATGTSESIPLPGVTASDSMSWQRLAP